MICPKCRYKNDSDASYCEKCGASLMGTGINRKILLVGGLVLIAIVGVLAGFILPDYLVHSNSSNSTVSNQTTFVSAPVSSTDNTSNQVQLIDSGSTSGHDNRYWNSDFKYDWEAYEYDPDHIEIKSSLYLLNQSNTIKQNTVLRKDPTATNPKRVIIDVSPKMSGNSSYETETTMQGYSTVKEYYISYLKPYLMANGPYT